MACDQKLQVYHILGVTVTIRQYKPSVYEKAQERRIIMYSYLTTLLLKLLLLTLNEQIERFPQFHVTKYTCTAIPQRGGEQWWIYRGAKRRGKYSIQRYEPTLRGIVILVFTRSVMDKNEKKVDFCKLKASLRRNFVCNL